MEDAGWVDVTSVTLHGRPGRRIAEPLSPTRPSRGSAPTDNSTGDVGAVRAQIAPPNRAPSEARL